MEPQTPTLFNFTQRPWLLQYSSPVVRMHVPFFGSILYLHNFLLLVVVGASNTETTVFPGVPAVPADVLDDAEEADDESLQIL